MNARTILTLPVLGLLGSLAWAQSTPVAGFDPAAVLPPPAALAEPAPMPAPMTVLSRSRLALGAETAALDLRLYPERPNPLSLESVIERLPLEGAPPATRDLLRAELDPLAGPAGTTAPESLAFHSLPGGIVLGREAAGDLTAGTPWAGSTVVWDGELLALRTPDGALHRLPAEPLDVLGAVLAFAARGERSDVLIDLSTDHVALATEFVGTPLAALLERADRAPGSYLKELAGRQLGSFKTLLLDRDVRLVVATGGERGTRPVPAATLELHVVAPHDPGALVPASQRVASFAVDPLAGRIEQTSGLSATEPPQALARELVPLARLAGWIGLLRQAERSSPGTLTRLRRELVALRGSELSLERLLPAGEPGGAR